MSLHGIKISRLKTKVLNFEAYILDGRESLANHVKIDESVKHIQLLPACESHYSRSQNKHKKYRNASLSVAKMYRAFIEANPDLQYVCKYSLYHKIFIYKFNIGFVYPRNDICKLCKKQEVDLKKGPNSW